MSGDVFVCQGCGEDVLARDLREALCRDCGGACQACRRCTAVSTDLTCDSCFDELLPWLALYVRCSIAAKLN